MAGARGQEGGGDGKCPGKRVDQSSRLSSQGCVSRTTSWPLPSWLLSCPVPISRRQAEAFLLRQEVLQLSDPQGQSWVLWEERSLAQRG